LPLPGQSKRYDTDLVSLRDEIGEARLEDVAALVAQMERLQGVSLRRAEAQGVLVDPAQPYFAHLRLREGGRERDVCIGRSTFVDPANRVSIVDWRHAPISQLYYRYAEGSDYEEEIGEREVEGEIVVRRTVTIANGELVRIAAPQGVFSKVSAGSSGRAWQRTDVVDVNLAGGEGTATRPKRGVLGDAGLTRAQRLDRHLPEIAALIDPRQFELISKPESGVVVIQGGAGSGKTTIGLHRMAYLAFKAPNRFPATHMLVVTYGSALAAYISEVLPALGVKGVRVATFQSWAQAELARVIPWLKVRIDDDSPPGVSRVKSHPAVLRELEMRGRKLKGKKGPRVVVDLWAELLTDLPRLLELCCTGPDLPLSRAEVIEAHRLIKEGVAAVTDREPTEKKPKAPRGKPGKKRIHGSDEAANQFNVATARVGERAVDAAATAGRDDIDDVEHEGDETMRGETGIDGLLTAGDVPVLDLGDVAILLRAHQLVRGSREGIGHLFVDEAQDLSPVELAVLIGETRGKPKEKSITLAGDTSQRLFLDNGFRDWRTVLHELALDHVAVEPLKIAYRSTREILQLARFAMGPLADREPPLARRSGAPVEAHQFPGAGAAVAFLADVLRPLFTREPRATVAILARHAEQADRYYDGLARAEIPSLRRVRVQDFSFRPGVEVTEIRQVKGLEFDYVILVDVNAATFGTDDESRHLFHIAATRAAHQLWLIVTGPPSPLFPPVLLAGTGPLG
ncbi:MAG TPA: ATP-binding domain-containing protein, partial [Polyangia bacterium]